MYIDRRRAYAAYVLYPYGIKKIYLTRLHPSYALKRLIYTSEILSALCTLTPATRFLASHYNKQAMLTVITTHCTIFTTSYISKEVVHNSSYAER